MQKTMFTLLILFIGLVAFGQNPPLENTEDSPDYPKSSEYSTIYHDSFQAGEEFEYKATFGWFTVGKATMKLFDKVEMINGRACYRIEAVGKTTGMVDWVVKVDDQWTTYMDTASLVAQRATRVLNEGNYKKHEITEYNHEEDSVFVRAYSFKRSKWTEPAVFSTPDNILDMLTGYYTLRTVDFTKMKKGDKIYFYGFLEDTIYNMTVIYDGKEKVRTKAGVFEALRIIPEMPENGVFDGKNSVVAWISDDENKIPIKVSAKLFLGNAGVELSNYSGLKHTVNAQK